MLWRHSTAYTAPVEGLRHSVRCAILIDGIAFKCNLPLAYARAPNAMSKSRGASGNLPKECLKFLYTLLRLAAHPHRKAGATSVIKRSSCSRFHGGRKVGM